MRIQYTDVDCSNLEGKEKFLCLMTKEIFWFDKPELSFGVYKVFRKKQRLIEDVLNNLINDLERSLSENESFERLKGEIYGELEAELDKLQKTKIRNSSNKEELKQVLKDAKSKYEDDLKEITDEEEKSELERIVKKIDTALDKLNTSEIITSTDIYNHLYNFFSLYYNKGDFGYTKNRYDVYQVSYEEKDFIQEKDIKHKACENSAIEEYDGGDILFRWQNWDTYYIKTLKYAKDYEIKDLEIFGKHINIKLIIDLENSEEPEGSKEQKLKLNESYYDESKNLLILKFILSKDETKIEGIINEILKFLNIKDEEIEVENLFTDKKAKIEIKKIIEKGSKKILTSRKSFLDEIGFPDKSKISTKEEIDKVFEENKDLNTFWKLLRGIALFKEGTDSDYFIHKNLKRFLTKELDKYIKNRIFSDTDDLLNNPQILDKSIKIAKLFKDNAEKIIDILSQIEDFQKKLWELRKLVKKAEYVISSKEIIDDDILELILSNEKQKKEWEEELKIPLPNDVEDLKSKSYPVDTKHFTFEEKYRILSVIENLEEKINGILIKSENFQALKFLEPKYTERIKTIYIDPPYNAKSSEILYKNTFKHSSWLSLMENRISLGKNFLKKEDGVFIIAIDENEQERLGLLLDIKFPEYKKTMVSVVHNRRGIQGENFRYTNEFAYFIHPEKKGVIKRTKIPEEEWEFSNLRNWGGESERKFGKNSFYPIYVDEETLKIVDIGYPEEDTFHPEKQTLIIEKDGKRICKVYPIDKEGIERKWRFARETLINFIRNYPDAIKIEKKDDRIEIKIAQVLERPSTCWYLKKYDASVYGTQEITSLFKEKIFDFPKSIWTVYDSIKISSDNSSYILDFFAGSGTTAHAIALLNTKNAKEIIEQILDLKKKIKTLKSEKAIKEKEKEIRELEEQLENIEFENRKYILAEINDYFDTVIIPRMKKIMYSLVWKDGEPQYPFGYSHIFKYLYLEQYEDLLEIYGTLDISQDDKDTEYIFNKDFNQLTNIRIKPLIKEPIDNPNYDLLETYIFHNNLDLVKVKYEDEILTADVKDKYDNNILILLSNNKNKLIDFINEKDLSDYNKVIVNLDLPDEEEIENNIEKIDFIKTSDLAGV